MKRFFLAGILAVLSSALNAQDWNVGFGGGYIHNTFSMQEHNAKGYSSFSVGAVFDYKFPSNVVLSSGLSFSQKGGTITGTDLDVVFHARKVEAYPMNYLTMPFMVGYDFKVGKFSILPQLGFYAGIGLWSKGYVEYPTNTGEIYRERFNLFNAPSFGTTAGTTNSFNCFDYGSIASISVTYDRFRLKAYYEYSLHELMGNWGDPRHRSFGLSFIVMLKK